MLLAESPRVERDNWALPALVDDSSFFLLWGTTLLVPGGGCASIQMRQQARRSSLDTANMWSFCCLLPPKLAWCFAASAMAASSVCLKSGLLGRKPKRTWAGLVWISKSKLKIYSSVWKFPHPNLRMDLKKYRLPCFCSVSNWELEGFILKKENKSKVK